MTVMARFSGLLALMILLVACAAAPVPNDRARIPDLARTIAALGADVDPAEAERAAEISITYSRALQQQYGVTDSALVHNAKVNAGLRPRGLCWHWAQDLERRLKQEGFETLDLHRGVANYNNLLIEHSTVLISSKGAAFQDALVLDPWRKGGFLIWAPAANDSHYNWTPRDEVLAFKRARKSRRNPGHNPE
ncbi:MAG: hypothetical protein CSA70_04555 [Rhodobacterales bacterium]|nr:MAG: hypothetical protein CSA70_04555 [Rhodobacterales bacterium]